MVKNNIIRNFKKMNISIFLILVSLLFTSLVFAIPNSLTLQGKLTNTAGASISGTNNFTFRIYDAFTDGNILWEKANFNITTDANGVYDVILPNINLSFADAYYLGITIGTDNESTPRINLTSSPYAFRANVSDALNPNGSYTITNLSVTGNATFGTDTTTTLKINGNLNATGNAAFGSSSTNTLTVNGQVTSNLIPSTGMQTLGSTTNFWHIAYIDQASIGNLSTGSANISGTLFSAFTLNANNSQGDINDVSLIFRRGTAVPNAILFWDSTNKRFDMNFPLFIEANQNLTVDTNTLFVDGSVHRVGINTTRPDSTLTVAGTLNVTSQNTRSGDLFVASGGSVGLGTTSPLARLESNGTIRVTEEPVAYRPSSGSGLEMIYIPSVARGLVIAFNRTASTYVRLDLNDLITLTGGATGNVGIGTTTPTQKLEVSGNFSTTTGALLATSSGNVGIGTTGPASKLEVAGTFNATQTLTSLRVTSDSNVIIHLE